MLHRDIDGARSSGLRHDVRKETRSIEQGLMKINQIAKASNLVGMAIPIRFDKDEHQEVLLSSFPLPEKKM